MVNLKEGCLVNLKEGCLVNLKEGCLVNLITVEGLLILMNTRHSWPLSSKGSFNLRAISTVTRGIRL